jgi:D-alanyl-D-alanine carboxypeptidase
VLGVAGFLAIEALDWGGSSAVVGSEGRVVPAIPAPGALPQPANGPPGSPAAVPSVKIRFNKAPRAGMLFDLKDGRILWQLNPERRLPIASLTKMMTGLMIAERHRPDERVRVTRQALAYQGSGIGLLPKGKRVTVGALLAGLILVSGNDAAIALAQHDAGTVERFIARMNRRAAALGLRCSRFSTPNGLRDKGNYSCARDLATLARADVANRRIRRLAATKHIRVGFPIKGGHLELNNNNPLLGERGITGLKTGFTEKAGRCYVVTARRRGRALGVVLLHSPNPIAQIHRLLRAGSRATS